MNDPMSNPKEFHFVYQVEGGQPVTRVVDVDRNGYPLATLSEFQAAHKVIAVYQDGYKLVLKDREGEAELEEKKLAVHEDDHASLLELLQIIKADARMLGMGMLKYDATVKEFSRFDPKDVIVRDRRTILDEQSLLERAEKIWGKRRPIHDIGDQLTLINVIIGDVARAVREMWEGKLNRYSALVSVEREFGNLLLSIPRWLDDLGLNVENAVQAAEDAQRAYVGLLKDDQ